MAAKELLKRLESYSVPELCDGMEVYQTMSPDIRHMTGASKMIGTAFTIDVPAGEGGFVAEALKSVSPGEIIVIAGKENIRSSYWGDHRSICAKKLGAAGVIVDGAFRDIDECEQVGLTIFARAVTPGTALKTGKGRMAVPVACGGVVVNPGDIIVGDRNGICVFSAAEAEAILRRTDEKIRNQTYTLAEMERTGKVITTVLAAK